MIWRGEAHHHGEVEVARQTRRGQMLANKRAPSAADHYFSDVEFPSVDEDEAADIWDESSSFEL